MHASPTLVGTGGPDARTGNPGTTAAISVMTTSSTPLRIPEHPRQRVPRKYSKAANRYQRAAARSGGDDREEELEGVEEAGEALESRRVAIDLQVAVGDAAEDEVEERGVARSHRRVGVDRRTAFDVVDRSVLHAERDGFVALELERERQTNAGSPRTVEAHAQVVERHRGRHRLVQLIRLRHARQHGRTLAHLL